MFETLSNNLGSIFDRLTRRGALSEKDVATALDEIRNALIEADVALPVARAFLDMVRPRAVGAEVLKSVTPGQQIVKIVNDALVDMLGAAAPINLEAAAPVPIMLVGLQGSGKTTSVAKLAKLLSSQKRKVLMASLDTQRPAAMEQLAVLGRQINVETLPIIEGQRAIDIASRALQAAKLGSFDVVLLDTAGRTNADEVLMAEMAALEKAIRPQETMLVVDSLTGQQAVTIAEQFAARITLTSTMLTRIDGDGRGGAALSMRHVTGVPIKYLGTGEAVDKLEIFDPERLANRILGMGDVVGLVEKAAATMDAEKAEKMAARMKKGQFTLEDMATQLLQMQKMGGMAGVLKLLPGIGGKLKKQASGLASDDKMLTRQAAIVSSMTQAEKDNPKLLNASRKKRIAAGSGTAVQDVNKLVKMHRQMADMMKKMGKGGTMFGGGALGDMLGGGNMGAPSLPDLNKLGGASGTGLDPNLLKGLGFPPDKKS
ncbi:MAG: signal recognition particle protein [Parvibaculales bacterium]